jgi:predicted NBD/HSP70 family sugar kinase
MENSTQNEATNETTIDTGNRDTSVAPIPAVLRRRIADAVGATEDAIKDLDDATLSVSDIAADLEDGDILTDEKLDAVAQPLRAARRNVKYLLDVVLSELTEKVGHTHAPDDLVDRAREIDNLLGALQAAVIHIEGEIVKQDEPTAKASQVAKECFHDLRLITATMRLPSVVGDGVASESESRLKVAPSDAQGL